MAIGAVIAAAPTPAVAGGKQALISEPRARPGQTAQGIVDVYSGPRGGMVVALNGLPAGSPVAVVVSRRSCAGLARFGRGSGLLLWSGATRADGVATFRGRAPRAAVLRGARTIGIVTPMGNRLQLSACGPARSLRAARTGRSQLVTSSLARDDDAFAGIVHVRIGSPARVTGIVTGLMPGATYGLGIGSWGCPASGKIVLGLVGTDSGFEAGADGVVRLDRSLNLTPEMLRMLRDPRAPLAISQADGSAVACGATFKGEVVSVER